MATSSLNFMDQTSKALVDLFIDNSLSKLQSMFRHDKIEHCNYFQKLHKGKHNMYFCIFGNSYI